MFALYAHPNDADKPAAYYLRLPADAAEAIDGGCGCRHCKVSGDAPRWDTLAIPLRGQSAMHAWRVHWPDLETTGVRVLGPIRDLAVSVSRPN